MNKIDELLNSVKGKKLTPDARIEKSIALAGLVLESALAEKRRGEKGQETKMMRMMKDPRGRIFITTMTDQCFRSHSSQRVADQLIYLLKKFGIPQFLSESDRMKFLFFRLFGNKIPQLFVPIIRKQIQHELAHVLLPETPRAREAYFQKCQRNNIRVNLNHLGEAILGEIEANRRFEIYLQDLLNPKIEYISIKISTIYSQINQIGYHASLTMLASRLRTLYRSAKANFFNRGDGTKIRKFVNLDMEEFRDLDLTVDLFQKVLNEPEFFDLQAGIVLQSYLPNSFTILQALTEWARERVKKGGAPIKLRLVKGDGTCLHLQKK
jgi:RHH-type proline utilization regulon transcriptional repressor/proline dehydrogenase/delta 1-pyrroline-5-carboxylate dehydrogenase